jgi:hypothetical protein
MTQKERQAIFDVVGQEADFQKISGSNFEVALKEWFDDTEKPFPPYITDIIVQVIVQLAKKPQFEHYKLDGDVALRAFERALKRRPFRMMENPFPALTRVVFDSFIRQIQLKR